MTFKKSPVKWRPFCPGLNLQNLLFPGKLPFGIEGQWARDAGRDLGIQMVMLHDDHVILLLRPFPPPSQYDAVDGEDED